MALGEDAGPWLGSSTQHGGGAKAALAKQGVGEGPNPSKVGDQKASPQWFPMLPYW